MASSLYKRVFIVFSVIVILYVLYIFKNVGVEGLNDNRQKGGGCDHEH